MKEKDKKIYINNINFCFLLIIQSTLNKWNFHGTEKNGSTYRMFHLSEWVDKWNLNKIEKKVPLIEPLSYLKSQGLRNLRIL